MSTTQDKSGRRAGSKQENTDGTQAIRRASAVLKAIAKAGQEGASLAEIARAEGLARSTAHRILKCLGEEELIEPSASGKRYRVGPLIHELSLIPMSSSLEVAQWRHAVEEVARRSGVTAYLMRRSGIEAVCLVKADGNAFVRFVPVEVGQRRLLGVGAGATALLAALDTNQTEDLIREISPRLERYPRLDPAGLRAAVDLARRTGFAMSQGMVVEDGFGMGAAIPADREIPHLAISIAAHRSTVTEAKIASWKKIISEEIRAGASNRR